MCRQGVKSQISTHLSSRVASYHHRQNKTSYLHIGDLTGEVAVEVNKKLLIGLFIMNCWQDEENRAGVHGFLEGEYVSQSKTWPMFSTSSLASEPVSEF